LLLQHYSIAKKNSSFAKKKRSYPEIETAIGMLLRSIQTIEHNSRDRSSCGVALCANRQPWAKLIVPIAVMMALRSSALKVTLTRFNVIQIM
jgi:hypothetical protein